MAINQTAGKILIEMPSRPLSGLTRLLVAAIGWSIMFFSFISIAFAQQRVVVEKATGNVVDVGDKTLQYDSRYFDNVDVDVSPIPRGADVGKYMRDSSGAIVLRPKEQLVAKFGDEWRSDITSRITAMRIPDDLKTLLIEIVKNMRR